MKILIIEDDTPTRKTIKYLLEDEPYLIYEESNGLNGLKRIKGLNPDMVILDINLPEIDGFSICSSIRKKPEQYGNPLILMLTARDRAMEVAYGLDIGADDYLKKPFDNYELVSRIKALFRRKTMVNSSIYKYFDLVIDTERISAKKNGIEINLSKKEFELLVYFVINKGITLSREKLMDEIWDAAYYSGNKTVDVFIKKLKEKIDTFADNIVNIRGHGYKLKSD